MTAQPDQDLRVYGSVGVDLDPASGQYTWSDITLGELYADYYGVPLAFIRVGKFSVNWGQGRLFTPGDIMADSDEGTAFRLSLPTMLSGISAIALAQKDFFAEPKNPSYRELAYGLSADLVFGYLRTGFGARYRGAEGLRTVSSLKTVLGGTDFFTDIIFNYCDGESDFGLLSGFYRSWGNLLSYGEYYIDATIPGKIGHSVGLALGYSGLFSKPLDAGVKWLHTWQDDSGSFTAGLVWRHRSHLSISAAVPITYGAEST
uniref:hypothetical protein n=1 Tax=Candidatus Oscillochloris fontis TaxID=2496868 RepID=UPI001291161D